MVNNMKKQDPFDAFIFGHRSENRSSTSTEQPTEQPSFDWMEFMKTMSDTYNAFNPYIKNLSKAIDKFKDGNNK